VLCYLCVLVGWPWKKNNLVQNVESKPLELKTVP
jgi:hypothetical protein